jgi:hypothetical protein
MDKLSIHLIKLLSYEGYWIWIIVSWHLYLCFCLDMRILKKINLERENILLDLCTVLFGLCQSGGILISWDEAKVPFKGIHIEEMNNCFRQAQTLQDLAMYLIKFVIEFTHCLHLILFNLVESIH